MFRVCLVRPSGVLDHLWACANKAYTSRYTHTLIYIYITHMAIFIRAYERILILGRCIYIYISIYIYIYMYIYVCVCKIKNERIYLLIDTYVL